MADQSEKPSKFRAGATSLSAADLNDLMQAIPRLLRGGPGICIEKYGDRYIIRLSDQQGSAVGTVGLATITDTSNDNYLVCEKDGATINVAKPWAVRGGVQWPSQKPDGTPVSYTYTDPETRTADDGTDTEDQALTPYYEEGEEIMVVRLPDARIDGEEADVRWEDMNTAGRCWCQQESA